MRCEMQNHTRKPYNDIEDAIELSKKTGTEACDNISRKPVIQQPCNKGGLDNSKDNDRISTKAESPQLHWAHK